MPRFRVMFRLLAAVTFAALPFSAFATTADVQVLMDTDNDPSTGCSVATAAGAFAGVEHVLTTTIQTDATSGTVVRVTRKECSGGTLSGSIDVDAGGWPVGIDATTGDALVETHLPLSVLGGGVSPNTRLAFIVSSGNSAQAVVQNADLHDIFFPVSERRRAITPGMGGPARVITLDGIGTDWDGITPFVVDPPGVGVTRYRIGRIFGFAGTSELWFRFDLASNKGAPIANDDTYPARQGHSTTVARRGVLTNDIDPNDPTGASLTALLVTNPAHGTLVLQPDGGFTYTNDGTLPTDVFTYKANNGSADSNTATVTLQITPNHAPTATPDSYTVAHGGTLIVPARGVLSNDNDVDGDRLTAVRDSNPLHASSFTLGSDGGFTYKHDGTASTTDSFKYHASDGLASSGSVTVTITITPGQPPVTQPDAYSANEDQLLTIPAPGVLSNDSDPEGGALTASMVVNALHGVVNLSPNGGFTYQPNPNYIGPDTFTYKASDGLNTTNGTVSLTVNPVNDAPSFANSGNVTVSEDAGPQSIAWASSISAGPPDESGQTLTFVITNVTNSGIFSTQPSISPSGQLTFQGAANANGTAAVTVHLHDSGGTANGGVDNSADVVFNINITPVNDAPSFANSGDVTVNEDAGPQSIAWASSISAGPADESGQTLSFVITNNTNSGLFTSQPSISPAGVLTFQSAPNANGTAAITVHLHDSGGTANGGVDNSGDVVFNINVTAVNDAPSFTEGPNQVVNEDAGGQTVLNWATGLSAGPADESVQTLSFNIVSNSNPGLFSSGPTITPTGTTATLAYTPAPNANGSATIVISISDNGGTANGGVDTSGTQTFTITVNPVNDAPSFSNIGDVTRPEDSGFQPINNWATSISAGPPDESFQTLSFVITNNTNTALFTTQPSISSFGVLSFQSAPDASGTATITVHLHDDGGTANGGVDNSADVVFNINITPVDDPPVVTLSGATPTYTENDPPLTLDNALTITDIDSTQLQSAVVLISVVGLPEDTLALPAPIGAITASYNSASSTLTLSGLDTLANYQAALRSVTYQNSSDNPTGTTRHFTWFATSSGGAQSSGVVSAMNLVSVDDAPTVATSTNLTFTENQGPTVIDGGVTVSDPDNTNLTGATVSITANFISGEDVLAFPGLGAITGSYNSITGALTLSGTDTVANYQAALRLVTYNNTSENPSAAVRTISWTATDGSATGSPATNTVTVVPTNDAPVVTAGGTVSFTENGSPVAIAPSLTVTDADNANLTGATVSITGNFAGAEDVLALPAPVGAITGLYSAGVLTLSGTDTVANYQLALRSVTYSNSSDNPSTAQRTVSFMATDGTTPSAASTTAVNVIAVNDPPVLTAGGTLSYTENQAATAIDTGLTVTDVDSATLTGATVSITGNFQSAEDVLALPAPVGSITGVYNSGVLTLSGTDTPANYQTALRSVTYFNSSDNPNTGARTITWVATDGAASSSPVTSTVNVAAVNDAPTVTPSTNLTYTEGQGSVTLDGGVTVTDPDSTQLTSATVQITGNLAPSEDVLALPAPVGSITGAYNSVTGTLTLSGTDSLANYQLALRSVTYTNTSNAPSTATRTVTWNATDTGAATGAGLTSTITVVSVNTPPTVTAGNTIGYTENQAATNVAPALTVTDPDSATLASATISITTGWAAAEDVLSFTTNGTITGSYNSGTGVLSLSGTDTVANYQSVLRTVKYFNSSDNPSTTSRTVVWVVSDGTDSSTPSNTTINITAVNDAPVLTVAPTASYTEDAAPTTLDAGMTVTDPDNANLTGATVAITGNLNTAQDVLSATAGGGITVGYNSGTGVLTLSGTASVSAYETVLRSVTYQNTSQNPSTLSRTITWTATDGTTPGSTTSSVTVVSVNDAPVVTAGGTVSFTENGSPVAIAPGLTVTDVDNTNLTGATISITGNFSNGQDVLALPAPVGSITGVYSSGTGVLTLSGTDTVANYQLALRSVTYSNSSENPSTAQRTVSFVATDGTTPSAPSTTAVNVNAVNDAPVLTVGGTLTYTEDQPPQPLNSSLTVTDVDSANLTGATISIIANFASGQDVLSFTPIGSITGIYNSTTGVLTLSGSDTVANYQTALRSVSYNNTSQNPSTAARTVTWTATDGTDTSAPATSTINVVNVNDAPVVTAGGTLNYTENQAATVIDNSITVTDVDSVNATGATVSIGPGFQSGADVLSFATLGPISGVYNGGTGVLTLSGTDSMTNYQAALRTVKYNNTSDGPTATPRTISWVVTDGITPSSPATSTVNVTPVNDPPVITLGGNLTYTENQAATAIQPSLTVTDVDSTNLTGATVSVSANYISAEDEITWTNSGAVTCLFNTGTGVLTCSGTDTVATYQTVLRSVKYRNLSDNPTVAARSITWTATDGTDTSTPQTSTITIVAVNDAPVVTAGSTLAYTEQAAATVIDNAVTVTDVDSANAQGATVTISAGFQNGADVLSFLTIGPISGVYNSGTGVLTLSGTDSMANYQAALRTVKFNNTSDAPTTPRTITWVVTDSGGAPSAGATSTINITAVNDAPAWIVPGAKTFNEDTPFTFSGADRIRISDPDSGASNISVTINTTHGNVNVPGGGVTVTNNNTHSVSISGTAANIDTAINNLVYTPDSNYNGADTINLHADDGGFTGTGGAQTADASIGITLNPVNDKPVFAGAPKTLTVEAHMKFVGATGLLTGVTDPDAGDTGFSPQTLQVDPTTINLTGCTGCVVTVTDVNTGTYDFEPPPGVGGGSTVSFTYTVKDNGNPAPGVNSDPITVTVTVNGPVIWFVNQTTGSDANNGTLSHPFQTLNKADTVDAANHRIFLFGGTYLTGITLNSGEWLTGQAATVGFDTMMGISPPAGTIARPATGLAAPIVPGVTTGLNSVLRGFDSSGTVTVNTTGVTASDMNISSGAATALSMTGGGGTLTFGTVTSTGGTSNIFMSNASGTISATGGALSGSTAAGAGIKIDGGNASLTYPGSITATAAGGRLVDIGNTTGITGGTINISGAIGGAGNQAGLGVRIQNGTGGTINFSGSQNFGTNGNRMTTDAVTIASNAGTAVNFNGTGLIIFTTGGSAKGVTVNTGTVAISGANNTISTTASAAVSVATNTGSMTFQSINISALAGKGVSVNGLTGSFSITGTAAPANSLTTGGTITGATATRGVELIGVTAGVSLSHMTFTNAAQSDGANPTVLNGTCGTLDGGGSNTGCNAAIHLQTVTGATLDHILVSGSAQMGINGNAVSNASLTSVEVTNAGTQTGEVGIEFYNLSGNCSITSGNIHNNFERGLWVQNNTGTLTALNILASTFSNNGGQGIVMQPYGTATMNMAVGDGTVGNQNTFTSNFSNAIQTATSGGASSILNITVNRNTFTSNNSAVVLQATSGTTTYNVQNNTATSGGITTGSCMYCFTSSSSGGFDGNLNGTFNLNTIGTNGVNSSGSNCGGCSGVSVNVTNASHQTATFAGNTIQGISNTAISIVGNGTSKGNFTITGNLWRSPNSTGASEALYVQSGSLAADTNCLTATIGGSNATAAPTTVAGAKNVAQGTWGASGSGSDVFVWRKSPGSVFNLPSLSGAADAFIDGNNTLSGATLAARVTAFGSGYTAGASCP